MMYTYSQALAPPITSSTTGLKMPELHRRINILELEFGYIPNKAAAWDVGAHFFVLSLLLLFRLVRRRDWWGLCLPIGTFCYCVSFFLRIVLDRNPESVGLFVVMQIFSVTSPAAFLAFNYIVFGRLLRNRLGDKYSYIRPRIVARTFIFSDLTTFSIQGSGGGITGNRKLGSLIVLIGLIAQTISCLVFMALLFDTHRRVGKDRIFVKRNIISMRIFYLLYFSSLFNLIRGIYRVIEFAQGPKGLLITHEIYFYVLDALPLFLATGIYFPFWPGQYISPVPEDELLGLQNLSNSQDVPQDIRRTPTEDL